MTAPCSVVCMLHELLIACLSAANNMIGEEVDALLCISCMSIPQACWRTFSAHPVSGIAPSMSPIREVVPYLCMSAVLAHEILGVPNRYVCLYDVEEKVLLRRVQISANRSLDGVLDQLNSKHLTDAGPAALLDDAPDDADPLLPPTTAGAPLWSPQCSCETIQRCTWVNTDTLQNGCMEPPPTRCMGLQHALWLVHAVGSLRLAHLSEPSNLYAGLRRCAVRVCSHYPQLESCCAWLGNPAYSLPLKIRRPGQGSISVLHW